MMKMSMDNDDDKHCIRKDMTGSGHDHLLWTSSRQTGEHAELQLGL